MLAYVNTQIFTNSIGPINDDYLIDNENKINIKLLKDIQVFYDKSELKNVEFAFRSLRESKTVESQDVTKGKDTSTRIVHRRSKQ